jgi:phosphoglycerate dehydrogenase-like enzyme
MNLTEENYHMFNKETFMKCKKHPVLINEGRGALVSDDDLVWALDNGYIKGAALDMLESENPDLSTCKLLGRDNVLLTPHCGYFSDTSNYLVAKLSMDNALAYYNGDYDAVKVIRNGVRK